MRKMMTIILLFFILNMSMMCLPEVIFSSVSINSSYYLSASVDNGNIITQLKNMATTLWNDITRYLSLLTNYKNLLNEINDLGSNASKWLVKQILYVYTGINTSYSSVIKDLINSFGGARKLIIDILLNGTDFINKWLSDRINSLSAMIKWFKEKYKEIMKMLSKLKQLPNIPKDLYNTISGFINWLNSHIHNTGNNKNTQSNKGNSLFNTISNIFNGLKKSAGYWFGKLSSTISSTFNAIYNDVSYGFSGVVSYVSNGWSGIVNTVSSGWSSFTSTVGNAVSNAVSTVSSYVGSFVSTVTSAFSSAVSYVSNAVSSFVSSVSNAISSFANSVSSFFGFETYDLSASVFPKKEVIDKLVDFLFDVIDFMIKSGEWTYSSLYKGIINALSAIGEWTNSVRKAVLTAIFNSMGFTAGRVKALVSFILTLPNLASKYGKDTATLVWTVIMNIGHGVQGIIYALGFLIDKYIIKPFFSMMNSIIKTISYYIKKPFSIILNWINRYMYQPVVNFTNHVTTTISRWFGLGYVEVISSE